MNFKTLLAALAFVSCGPPDVSEGGSTPTPASSAALNCEARCEAKLVACRATADTARPACVSECMGSITEEALGCLERATCTAVMTASSWAGLCPTGSSAAGGGSASAGGRATGGGSASGGGSATAATWPSAVTLRASIGSQRVTSTVTSSGAIGTSFSVTSAVQRSPSNASRANLSGGTLRVVSPSFGACTQLPQVTWSDSAFSLTITTLDAPGSSDCKRAVTAMASGARIEVQRAPYADSPGRNATVTIELSR